MTRKLPTAATSQSLPSTPLLSLPLELHHQISLSLPYPDHLALRHTHPHFYLTLPSTIKDKVAWLISRHERQLPCPNTRCILASDAAFCYSGDVRSIMERRRRHQECKGVRGGCEVVLGGTCPAGRGAWARILRARARRQRAAAWAVMALLVSLAMNLLFAVL